MSRLTGIFSTTRNYNPGDEFILFGIQNLLREVTGPFNTVYYNRNPAVQNFRMTFDKEATIGTQTANWYQTMREHFSERENTWAPELGLDFADFAVFAGTPEWVGRMVEPLTTALADFKGPILYLGLGSVEVMNNCTIDDLLGVDQTVLKKADLITVRDTAAAKFLAPLNPHELPCPALFSAQAKPRTQKQKIAVSFQGTAPTNTQRTDSDVRDYMIKLLEKLNQHFTCSVIAHYVDELAELKALIPQGIDLIYHADAADYIYTYDQFDLVVTTRVHGAGLASALGIPAYAIAHSHRSQTADGFLAETVDIANESVDEVFSRIQQCDTPAKSKIILQHQMDSKNRYLEFLKPLFAPLTRHDATP